jgi:site-specific DNA recombinase
VHKGKVVADATWPPILDEATFYALAAKLGDPKRRTQRDSAVKHLLSGIAVCGVCGGRIRVQKNRGFLAYLCVGGFCVSRHEDPVDEFVAAVVVERLSRPDVLDLLADDDDEVQAARAQAAELRARLDGFCDTAAAGDLTPAALARIEATLLPQIEQAEKRARTAVVSPAVADAAGPDIAERWASLPLSARREIIDTLLTVKILPTGKGRRRFDPSAIAIEWKA